MSDAGLHIVLLSKRLERRAQIVRRQRLSDRTDVVAFAFDGQQCRLADGGGLDAAAAIFKAAARQFEFLENLAHGFLRWDCRSNTRWGIAY